MLRYLLKYAINSRWFSQLVIVIINIISRCIRWAQSMLMLKLASLLHWMEKLKETAKGRRSDTQLFLISKRKNWPIKFANCSRYMKGDICYRAFIPINLFLKIFSEFSLFSDNKPSKRLSTANQVWKNHCCLSDSHLPAVKKKLLGCRSNLLETMPIRSLFCF